MELLSHLGASAFTTNVLHVEAFAENVGVAEARGEDNDPISNGMDLVLDYNAYDNDIIRSQGQSPDVADTITISTNAAPIFRDASSDRVAGLRFPRGGSDTAGRVVFLAFPFDAVQDPGDAPNNRATLMRNVLSFLAPGVGGLGTLTLDRAAYTLPDLITIEVGDSDLAGQGHAAVQCYSTSMTNGLTVNLTETARRGLFRGVITLGPTNAVAGSAQLRAQPGDEIWVEYNDASSASIVRASAVVDVQAPTIAGVSVNPAYEEATVQWTTSEPTDGLVQFGESAFLGRTAYEGEPSADHALTLVGLQPDRQYYYQIVSRDRAGNTVLDNNGGKFYSFRTLKPLISPWVDNLDGPSSTNDWSVVNGDLTVSMWTLGVPNNGLETAAHSPPDAWGSNLEGASIDQADTTLVGPPVQLTGGNVATLRFWQSYDFTTSPETTGYEYGQLYISTNNAADWTLLKEYSDATVGWQEEEIDLSPYLGRVVRLEWSYELLATDPSPRPGWLLDDLSLVVTNLIVGKIQISNNLAQATFSLTGPVNRSGQGSGTNFNNLPAGQYVLQFGDVPFYQTPSPQTNVLSGGSILFTGTYTFADANHNGISDAWEEHYFGSVAPSHPGSMDSDGDGLTDYAEFIAGTDPTDPNSSLEIMIPVPLPTGNCRLTWTSAPGHAYRVVSGTSPTAWAPLSAWLRASTNQLSYTVPSTRLTVPQFFRVEVAP
jgi:hypothetical protein